MKLLTFNIRTSAAVFDLHHHWKFRKDRVLEAIQHFDADIVGLQEARHKPLEFLTAGLPASQCVSAGRNDGQTKGEACPIFVAQTFSVDSFEFRWLSETPEKPGTRFPDTSQPRICSVAHVTELATGKKAAFVNTHLDTEFRHVREKSLLLISSWAKADDIPWIIFGDLNCQIDWPELDPLLKHGWNDALSSLPAEGEGAGTFNNFKHKTDGPRIDHILVPEGVTVESFKIHNESEGKPLSDHWPVTVELKL